VVGECPAKLPKLILYLICISRQLALRAGGFGSRRFDEGEIRPRLIARDQVALPRFLILRLSKRQVGSLVGQLGIHTAALIRPGLGYRAEGRTVRSCGTHILKDGGT